MDSFWILLAFLAVIYVIWWIVKSLIYSIFYVAAKAMRDAKRDD